MNAPVKIHPSTIDHAKSDIVSVIGKYVDLKKNGNEFSACCPFHNERTPSFTVQPEKQFFYCFGCGASGDAIEFVSKFEDIGFRDAVKSIVGNVTPITLDAATVNAPVRAQKDPEWLPQVPVPADITQKPMDTFNRRKGDDWERLTASQRWEYRDAAGELIGYVCRFELPGGGKDVMPQSFCMNSQTGEVSWRWMSFAKPRPLYGLDKLAKHPNAQVMVVEGEKTADAAQARYEAAGISRDKLVTVSWPGGGKAVKHTDWSPLHGRKVGLWPDADQKSYAEGHAKAGQPIPVLDQAGVACMLHVAELLAGNAQSLKLIEPPAGVPDGWDLADELPDGWDLLAHSKAAACDINAFRMKHAAPAEAVDELPAYVTEELPTVEEMPDGEGWRPTVADDDEDDVPATIIGSPMVMQDHDFPDRSKKMRPLNTIRNLDALMQHYGITARYNLINKETELVVPDIWTTSDNAQNVHLAHLNSLAAQCGLPRENLTEYVKAIADANAYNPVLQWIESKPWDGVSRIQALAETLTLVDSMGASLALRDLLVRRWVIACAAALEAKGFSHKGVLTLHGAQDLGKTSWFRRLTPTELGAFREGVSLNPESKDSVMTAVSHWIVELGELESTLRRDMESLKSFITQPVDRLRRPYDRVDSEYPRRTVFCASVNSQKFLKDDTGNGRFWVIECASVDYKHEIDIQQMWAEALTLYRNGEAWHLTPAEKAQLNEGNEKFRQVSPIEELITTLYDLGAPNRRWVTATSVLIEIGYDKPTRAQATETGQILQNLEITKRSRGGRTEYYLPSRLTGDRYHH